MNIAEKSNSCNNISCNSQIILTINKRVDTKSYINIKKLSLGNRNSISDCFRFEKLYALVHIPNIGSQFIGIRHRGRIRYLYNSKALSINDIVDRKNEAISNGFEVYYCNGLLKHKLHIIYETRRGDTA